MANTLLSRRTEAQLHALAGAQRETGANDHNGRRKYLQDYTRAFRSYQSVINRDELMAAVAAAAVVLIGDYHALPSAQQFAATLLESRALAGDRPVVLGVETIFARDPHLLQEWSRPESSESEPRKLNRITHVPPPPVLQYVV